MPTHSHFKLISVIKIVRKKNHSKDIFHEKIILVSAVGLGAVLSTSNSRA